MNIGLVTPYFPDKNTLDSGLANHFSTLAESLANLGHKIVVVYIRPKGGDENQTYEEQLIGNNITVLTYKAALSKGTTSLFKNRWSYLDFLIKIKCMLIAFQKLGAIQKKYQLDVIETSSYFSLCFFYLFNSPKIPVVTRVSTTFLQMMDDYYPFKSRLYRLIGRLEIRMIRKSRHLITHAKGHAVELKNLYNIDPSKFTIIPHGIRIPAAYIKNSPETEPVRILYVGRFEYRKGTDVLLKAIPLVLYQFQNVVFELVGMDPHNEYRHNFSKENSELINHKVFFRGKLDEADLHDAYQNCDIFVAPSRYESFGLIYIEAMSYGKPVIGCRVGGVTDIIEDNFNGLFAETGSAADLAKKIGHLIANKDLVKTMGENARTTALEKFSQDVLGKNSVAYYQSVLNNRN